jgi:AmmeMemoRadiSam system protein B/AmmeMemoRadiSam system protein A
MWKRLLLNAFILVGGLVMTNFFDSLMGGSGEKIRRPAVSGTFYPDNPDHLRQSVDKMIAEASPPPVPGHITALISPHAGYIYSGQVASHGYATIKGKPIRRVVIISPSHLESFQGAAVYDGDAYKTPLGTVPVDKGFCSRLAAKDPLIKQGNQGHRVEFEGRGEHALEVQLPFLQRVLEDFELVPIVMGDQTFETCRALGRGIAALAEGTDTLIVASSDLSHYHPYDEAVQMDRKVIDAVVRWDYLSLLHNLSNRSWEACGGGPIAAAMIASEEMGATQSIILRYANSGDVAQGDRSHVVGYVSAALYKPHSGAEVELPETELDEKEKQTLLEISRESVASAVRGGDLGDYSPPANEALQEDAAVFVTLWKHGDLRGCVGSILATEPLTVAVANAAANAALNDHRFNPVREEELEDLQYEISVLSHFRRITDLAQLQVGRHGLLIEKGNYRGLLLPQVATEHDWDAVTFLEHTCQKAGLPSAAWKEPEADIYIFSANVFGEGD